MCLVLPDTFNENIYFLSYIYSLAIPMKKSSFKWRVTVSGDLIFLESYSNCDVTNTVTVLL